jgi:ABC-type nitrate/sulfonate/bicarbonate transport system permease component
VTGRAAGARARLLTGLASIVVCLLAYALVSNLYRLVDTQALPRSLRLLLRPGILPPIQAIGATLAGLAADGTWGTHLLASLGRVVAGLGLGVAVGMGAGLAMGWWEAVDHYLDPLYNLVRPVPPLAFVTLFILWFGIGEWSKILLIAYGVAMTTLVPTYQGVRDVPVVYLRAARVLGVRPWLLFHRVILPAALPRILAGLRLGLMAAWGIIVAAELIASTSGLGYLIVFAQTQYDTALVMVGIVSLAATGFVMDRLLERAGAHATRWMRRAGEAA